MGWKKWNTLGKPKPNTRCRYQGAEGQVGYGNTMPEELKFNYTAVLFDNSDDIDFIKTFNLEVWEDDPQPEPKVEFRETEYFVELSTGALFKRQYEDFKWHLIALGTIRKSITTHDSHPAGFKRLYREV